MVEEQQEQQVAALAMPPRRGGRRLLLAVVLLLLVIAAVLVAAWQFPAAQRHILGAFGLEPRSVKLAEMPAVAPSYAPSAQPPAASVPAPGAVPPPGSVDARIALLEERLTRLDIEAEAASGNAARAEGLLVAFAARRALDRGAQLGFLEEQLRLRFADAQPNAVKTLVDASAAPVTLDSLYAQLDALAPALTGNAPAADSWSLIKREVSQLFIIRHQTGAAVRADDRLAKARLLLAAGKVGEAVSEVERLPGAAAAKDWAASARRYDSVQAALDLIETTALLDASRLKDGKGERIQQASPLAGPAD